MRETHKITSQLSSSYQLDGGDPAGILRNFGWNSKCRWSKKSSHFIINYYYILLLLLPVVLLLLSFVPNNIPTKRSWLSTQACLHRALGQPLAAERSFTAPRQRPAGFPRALAAAAELGGSLVRPRGRRHRMSWCTGKTTWETLDFADFFDILFGDMKSLPIIFFLKLCSPKNPPFQWNLLGRCLHFIRHRPEQIQGKDGETVKEQFSRQIFNGQKSKSWVFESWRSHMGMGQDLLLPYKKYTFIKQLL